MTANSIDNVRQIWSKLSPESANDTSETVEQMWATLKGQVLMDAADQPRASGTRLRDIVKTPWRPPMEFETASKAQANLGLTADEAGGVK